MSNFNNPKNALGMGAIYASEDDINIDALEQSITSEGMAKQKTQAVDFTREFGKEIESLTKTYSGSTSSASTSLKSLSTGDEQPPDSRGLDDILEQLQNSGGGSSSLSVVQKKPIVIPKSSTPMSLLDEIDESASNDEEVSYFPKAEDKPERTERRVEPSKSEDPQLQYMTEEARKRDHLHKILGTIDRNSEEVEMMTQEDEEEEMIGIIEQIDHLRSNLSTEGIDVSKIPEVTKTTTKKEAKSILRLLQIRNDRIRYCNFFDEAVLTIAYGLESIFNGQREVFGSKIDLTGYSDTVKIKLRRMRYDTSNFVSGIMKGYNIGSGWRMALELIPSLFLYSRDRSRTSKDNLMSDESYKKAMQELS